MIWALHEVQSNALCTGALVRSPGPKYSKETQGQMRQGWVGEARGRRVRTETLMEAPDLRFLDGREGGLENRWVELRGKVSGPRRSNGALCAAASGR